MLDAIAKRCSVRSYTKEPVSDEDLQEVLKAALSAPSANNVRPWQIIVVRDAAKRTRLSEASQWARFCAEASVVLVFCGDTERQPYWWIEDCSASVENALIQAASLGLGTCWVGIRDGQGGPGPERQRLVRDALGIPQHISVLALVSLGHPAGETNPKQPGPMDAVHYEVW